MIKYIIVALGLGVLAGYSNSNLGSIIIGDFVINYLFNFSLILLLFVMGVSFGFDEKAVAELKRAGFRVLIVPLMIVFGSILGGIVGALILGINIIASMALCAGYGWYTLSGPLVGQIFGPEFGALGFTVNFLRELLTIITAPLIFKFDKYAPIASGGATTMDTTLPIIVRYCGSETLVTAFLSGFILTLIAPFTIIAVASLG